MTKKSDLLDIDLNEEPVHKKPERICFAKRN